MFIQNNETFTVSLEVTEPFNMYIMAYYWVTTTTLQLSFGSIMAEKDKEVIFIICVIVTG